MGGLSLILLSFLYVLAIAISLFANQLTTEFSTTGQIIIILIAFLVSLVVYYFQFFRPLFRLKVKHLEMLLAALFEALSKKYYALNPDVGKIRINVMRLRRKIYVPWKPFLRIDFCSNGYLDAEKEQKYCRNVGCCGTAIAENTLMYFDANQVQLQQSRNMTATQLQVTKHVKSILSTPIYRPWDIFKSSPIGVINLDSEDELEKTKFDKDYVQNLVPQYAELIGPLLP